MALTVVRAVSNPRQPKMSGDLAFIRMQDLNVLVVASPWLYRSNYFNPKGWIIEIRKDEQKEDPSCQETVCRTVLPDAPVQNVTTSRAGALGEPSDRFIRIGPSSQLPDKSSYRCRAGEPVGGRAWQACPSGTQKTSF
jgi:hypothetical protein